MPLLGYPMYVKYPFSVNTSRLSPIPALANQNPSLNREMVTIARSTRSSFHSYTLRQAQMPILPHRPFSTLGGGRVVDQPPTWAKSPNLPLAGYRRMPTAATTSAQTPYQAQRLFGDLHGRRLFPGLPLDWYNCYGIVNTLFLAILLGVATSALRYNDLVSVKVITASSRTA